MNRPRRFSRHIPLLLVLLIAGMMTAIAIAYLGTVLYPPTKTTDVFTSDMIFHRATTPIRTVMYTFEPATDVPLTQAYARRAYRVAISQSYTEHERTFTFNGEPMRPQNWRLYQAGWPCRAAWGWSCTRHESGRQIGVTGGFIDVRTPHFNWTQWPPTVELPFLPLWRGLILNTLLYAAIWWILLALPRLIRRTLRARRSCCRSCGYDMRGLTDTPCPECGHACRPRRAR